MRFTADQIRVQMWPKGDTVIITHFGGVGFNAVGSDKIVNGAWNVWHGERIWPDKSRHFLYQRLRRRESEINKTPVSLIGPSLTSFNLFSEKPIKPETVAV